MADGMLLQTSRGRGTAPTEDDTHLGNDRTTTANDHTTTGHYGGLGIFVLQHSVSCLPSKRVKTGLG